MSVKISNKFILPIINSRILTVNTSSNNIIAKNRDMGEFIENYLMNNLSTGMHINYNASQTMLEVTYTSPQGASVGYAIIPKYVLPTYIIANSTIANDYADSIRLSLPGVTLNYKFDYNLGSFRWFGSDITTSDVVIILNYVSTSTYTGYQYDIQGGAYTQGNWTPTQHSYINISISDIISYMTSQLNPSQSDIRTIKLTQNSPSSNPNLKIQFSSAIKFGDDDV